MPYQERILPPLDHKETAKKRSFTPKPFTTKPSELFPNQVTVVNPPYVARFRSKDDHRETLIYISGRNAGTKAAPHRPVFAYVWGQPVHGDEVQHHAIRDLEGRDYSHTAERAQLHAIITALRSSEVWKLERRNHVVIAFSGDYILNNVARVDLREQIEKEKPKVSKEKWHKADNLDLKCALVDELEKMDDERLLVRFWQIDGKYNEAEKLFKVTTVPGAYIDSEEEA